MRTEIKFFLYGLKTLDAKTNKYGSLQKAYIRCRFDSNNTPHIAVTAKEYQGFDDIVNNEFRIKNETDTQSDYFEKDHFCIYPDNKYFADALKICIKNLEKIKVRYEKTYGENDRYNYLCNTEKRLALLVDLSSESQMLKLKQDAQKVGEGIKKSEREKVINDRICLAKKIKVDNDYNIDKVIVHYSESSVFEINKVYSLSEFLTEQSNYLITSVESYSGGYEKTVLTISSGLTSFGFRLDLDYSNSGNLIEHLKSRHAWLKRDDVVHVNYTQKEKEMHIKYLDFFLQKKK